MDIHIIKLCVYICAYMVHIYNMYVCIEFYYFFFSEHKYLFQMLWIFRRI